MSVQQASPSLRSPQFRHNRRLDRPASNLVQEAIQVTPVRYGAAAAWENRLGNASSPCPVPGRSRRCAVETASDCSRRADRRRRSGGTASTLHSCRVELANKRLGRPYVFGAVQIAPTPRIRPREVQRCGRRREGKSRPSNLQLALVAYWYGLAVCAETLSPHPASCAGARRPYLRAQADSRATSFA